MDNFKEASKQRLRFTTSHGVLSVEQLWDLSISQLDTLAVSLEEQHKTSARKSFVVKKTAKDKTAKLMFDIALDILNTKIEEQEALSTAAENKEHNQMILSLMKNKEHEELAGKSMAELKKMLKK